jgi:hypothetical protein
VLIQYCIRGLNGSAKIDDITLFVTPCISVKGKYFKW